MDETFANAAAQILPTVGVDPTSPPPTAGMDCDATEGAYSEANAAAQNLSAAEHARFGAGGRGKVLQLLDRESRHAAADCPRCESQPR